MGRTASVDLEGLPRAGGRYRHRRACGVRRAFEPSGTVRTNAMLGWWTAAYAPPNGRPERIGPVIITVTWAGARWVDDGADPSAAVISRQLILGTGRRGVRPRRTGPPGRTSVLESGAPEQRSAVAEQAGVEACGLESTGVADGAVAPPGQVQQGGGCWKLTASQGTAQRHRTTSWRQPQ